MLPADSSLTLTKNGKGTHLCRLHDPVDCTLPDNALHIGKDTGAS